MSSLAYTVGTRRGHPNNKRCIHQHVRIANREQAAPYAQDEEEEEDDDPYEIARKAAQHSDYSAYYAASSTQAQAQADPPTNSGSGDLMDKIQQVIMSDKRHRV